MARNASLRPILFGAALALISCCGSAYAAVGSYVGNLGGLAPISAQGFEGAYAKDGTLPRGFSSVFVAPVSVISGQDKWLDDLAPSDYRPVQDYLQRRLTDALSKKFSIADKPGPGVLIVAASFTELRPNKPTMTELGKNPGEDYARSFGIGRGGVQIDIRDGGSGALLAAFVDHEQGDPINVNTNLRIQWGDVEQFSRDWASELAEALAH